MRYFRLMLKRLLRLCPAVLGLSLLLTAAVGALGALLLESNAEESAVQMKVGVVGNLEESTVGAALYALEHLDDSRVYVDLLPMEEAQARLALDAGEITGYLLIPEDFVQGILERRSVPLRFVVKGGPSGMGSLLLLEACTVAAEMVEECQRGIYGMQLFVRENQWADESLWSKVDALTLRYADSVLNRGEMATVIPLGAPQGVSLPQYVLSAVLILLVLLWGVSCYGILRRRDLSLEKMLAASRGGFWRHCLGEYSAFFLFSGCFFFLLCLGTPLFLPETEPVSLFFSLLPGLLALTAMEFFLYQLLSDGVGTLLGLFSAALALGYVSGCMYPLWFFPPGVQALSLWLPTGAAMAWMRGCLGQSPAGKDLGICLAWAVVFLALSLSVRKRALRR